MYCYTLNLSYAEKNYMIFVYAFLFFVVKFNDVYTSDSYYTSHSYRHVACHVALMYITEWICK